MWIIRAIEFFADLLDDTRDTEPFLTGLLRFARAIDSRCLRKLLWCALLRLILNRLGLINTRGRYLFGTCLADVSAVDIANVLTGLFVDISRIARAMPESW